ncbi:alpha/beta fold hydrolase family protein [Chitinophaga sp. GCM10012297]|uniref:Homoserine O-acetyltransferase n=1 Tax=Chitinophaga chungangae TaxID=2821488 RepID=A0ABS3YHS0_9BACT|nr:alpha/beta fold hydrolase [Chitinophaga chungangae]MBO9154244.1 alpha/beta fold hydrolase [Chitinophaga chungangae]
MIYHNSQPFTLESGEVLPGIDIAFHTYGTLSKHADNVIWICHALTANSDAADWWKGLVGEGNVMDPSKYFIVCANILGSCYGSSGPVSSNRAAAQPRKQKGAVLSGSLLPEPGEENEPGEGTPYYRDFPQITIRDIVHAHILLRKHLNIDHIYMLAGGSMGGYQVLEWSLMEPERIGRLFLLCTGAAESAWGIAVHTSQRLAIEADSTWQEPRKDAGAAGLKAARAIGMLTYRNYQTFMATQTDPDKEKTDGFRASSYIEYQGEKLVKRFNAQSYWLLTKAMDSHNIARGRHADVATTLRQIEQKTLLIGITSDILCPPEEQMLLAQHMHNCLYHEIDSPYGHDGFLIEFEKIGRILAGFLDEN